MIRQRAMPNAACRTGCSNPQSDLFFDSKSRISIFNLWLLLDRTFGGQYEKAKMLKNETEHHAPKSRPSYK